MPGNTNENAYASCVTDWFHGRSWRHSPCLMRPVTFVGLSLVGLVAVVSLLCSLPGVLLGLLIAPLAKRTMPWAVEFWYPLAVGRMAHLGLLKLGGKGRNNNSGHSRAAETRIEIVPGRLYIHILPQLLDNLAYLLVCVPPPHLPAAVQHNGQHISVHSTPTGAAQRPKIVGLVVDCGDADAVLQQTAAIAQRFYGGRPIHVQTILSTHQHWDHTAGNAKLWNVWKNDMLQHIVGGAVDHVPGCNYPVGHGDAIPLPQHGHNKMADLCTIKVVATPAHTRGSVCYVLVPNQTTTTTSTIPPPSAAAVWFTGDTMFHGGAGVPFEADYVDPRKSKSVDAYSALKATAAGHAVERCFAQLLYLTRLYTSNRQSHNQNHNDVASQQVLVLVGHEYTVELLQRQLVTTATSNPIVGEGNHWKYYAPAHFFATAANYYVALHRRGLPQSTGKLLCAPTTLRQQLLVNPHMRNLRKRAELLAGAIRHWNDYFAVHSIPDDFVNLAAFTTNNRNNSAAVAEEEEGMAIETTASLKTSGSTAPTQWNVTAEDVDRPVFCTVYASELEQIIQDLNSGAIAGPAASLRLQELQQGLQTPAIGRRPIPATLPTDRNMYKGLLALVILGSPPTALTLRDADAMNLPPPVATKKRPETRTRISRNRLLVNLEWLGVLDPERQQGHRLEAMIRQLWDEAHDYHDTVSSSQNSDPDDYENHELQLESNYSSVGVDSGKTSNRDTNGGATTSSSTKCSNSKAGNVFDEEDDEVELVALRWVLYGLPWKPPTKNLMFCLPCKSSRETVYDTAHPVSSTDFQQHGGEMVRHDIMTCALCQSATGKCTLHQPSAAPRPPRRPSSATAASGAVASTTISVVSGDDVGSIKSAPSLVSTSHYSVKSAPLLSNGWLPTAPAANNTRTPTSARTPPKTLILQRANSSPMEGRRESVASDYEVELSLDGSLVDPQFAL